MANLVTRSYITSLETNMRVVSEAAFDTVFGTLHYDKVASTITDEAAEVKLIIDIDSTSIDHFVDEGDIRYQKFDELDVTLNYAHSTAGLRVKRSELTDSDYGAEKVARWSRRVGAKAAYTPEEMVWGPDGVIQQNAVSVVDGKQLFAVDHPNNPKDLTKGVYSNLLTSLPIDITVALDVALKNLGIALGRIGKIVGADGKTSRRLVPKYIFGNPALQARGKQLTGATVINATDVTPLTANNGLTWVTIPELTADTAFYIGVEEIAGSELGAVIFWEREPFLINPLDMTDKQLSNANMFEWNGRGREGCKAAIPFKLFKVTP